MTMTFDDTATIKLQWVVDSETGIEYLLNQKTGQKMGIKINDIWLNPEEKPQ